MRKPVLLKTCLMLLVFSLAVSISLAAGIEIQQLRCDEKENPVGVSFKDIRFSWLWKSIHQYDRQSSYRIVVASDWSKLEAGEYDVWDSGQVASDRNVQLAYEGVPLEGNCRYYWKVKIWNARGEASGWSCSASFVPAIRRDTDWLDAKWIGLKELPVEQRLVPGIHVHENHQHVLIEEPALVPYLRKSFVLKKAVSEAFLSVSGLGHYEAFINGEKVGNSFLAPGWTHYDKQVLFNTYDVTSLLVAGNNALSALVGNGFHYINHQRYLKLCIVFGYPRLRCRLKVCYFDGTEENIVSDASWKTYASPIIFSSIYGGEDYDARKEQNKWNCIGYDDSQWPTAMEVAEPTGKLEPETTHPLAVMDTFQVQKIYALNDSCFTCDFGQNSSGIVRIKVKGRKGQKLRIWPGELLSGDQRVNQKASGEPYYFEYILNGADEYWQPKFTYYGFRYVTIEGACPAGKQKKNGIYPEVSRIEKLHIRNSAPQVGRFECSSDLMNRIFSLIDWAIKSNMQSVMTDCPHREKLGWLEQSYLMGNSIRYNYSVYHLYRKKIRDMMHAQRDNGLIPDIAPEYVVFSGGFVDSPEWGSAGVILPWLVYKWYGDKSILSEAYPMMQRYVDYLRSMSADHLLSHGLGDWFDYGPNPPGVAQLTPVSLTATAIYYYDIKLLAGIALTLGKMKDAAYYEAWANQVKDAFNKRFYDPVGKTYATGSQTSIAMPLCVGLVEEADREAVLSSLCRSIERDQFALTAGDIGFHFLVAALSNDRKSAEVLYKMINRKDVPGYGFQLAKGATALTESWPALEEVSNNHLMLGHIMEWFYTCLLGINDAPEAIASDKIILRPMPVGDIKWVQGAYQSPRGTIKLRWEKTSDSFLVACTVPNGVRAKMVLPEPYHILSGDKSSLSSKSLKWENNKRIIELLPGEYTLCFREK